MEDAAETIENDVNEVADAGDLSNNSFSLLLFLGLLGVSVSVVGLSIFKHNNRAAAAINQSVVLTPSIYLLLGSAGGLAYLFYSSVYNEVGNAADTVSIMMRMSPVVYSLYFLAAAIPAIEVYMHPRPESY